MKRIMMVLLLAGLTPATGAGASVLAGIDACQTAGLTLTRHFVQVTPAARVAVKGQRERRQVRFARLAATWSADKRSVADAEGFPLNRLLELQGGRRTETWTYPESHAQYVFDSEGHLIERRLR